MGVCGLPRGTRKAIRGNRGFLGAVTMARYSIEGVARGIAIERLWDWYTDFRSDDVEIIDQEAPNVAGVFENRQVRRDGDQISIDQVVSYGGRKFPVSVEISLHPKEFRYATVHRVRTAKGRPMMTERRQYTFARVAEATRVHAECVIEEVHGAAKLFNVFGLVTRMARKGSQEVMDAFMRGAEKELSNRKDNRTGERAD